MDVERFVDALPRLFEKFPDSPSPCDARFDLLIECIPGLSTQNVLAILNLAASLIARDETYLEIGTWKGLSLVAAALGHRGDFVALDDFSRSGSSAPELRAYLDQIGLGKVTVVEGDAAALLGADILDGLRVGACYRDASHVYNDQLEILKLLERHLADDALVICDDADWDPVAAACDDYIARSPGAELLMALPGRRRGFPQWWHGLRLVRFRAPRELEPPTKGS